jgi:pimeloyl-ACP methyl ester carboxylesterase
VLEAAGEAGPFVPVGFSFGGLVARLFASTYPDGLAGLVLVEGSPPGWNIVDMAAGWFGPEQEGIRDEVAGRDPIAPSSPLDQFLSEAQVVAAPASARVPTVVVVADRIEAADPEDPGAIVPWAALDAVATYYDLKAGQVRDLNARIVVAPESGHLVPFEQPEVLIAAMGDLVKAVRDPSSWATPVP